MWLDVSPQSVSRGDSVLDSNNASLTWHIMTLPAMAPPLSQAGHKLLSNGPQQCLTLPDEVTLERDDKHGRPGWGQGVPAILHLLLCHMRSAVSLVVLSPCSSPYREEYPSQNMCKRIKPGSALVVALSDQRQDPCVNLSYYTDAMYFTNLFYVYTSIRETSGDSLIKLSAIWWMQIRWGNMPSLFFFFCWKANTWCRPNSNLLSLQSVLID